MTHDDDPFPLCDCGIVLPVHRHIPVFPEVQRTQWQELARDDHEAAKQALLTDIFGK